MTKKATPDESSWWLSHPDKGAEGPLGHVWKSPDKVFARQESVFCVLFHNCMPLFSLGLWRWVFDSLLAPGMGLGVAGAGCYLGFEKLLTLSLCDPLGMQRSFYHIT